MAKQFEYHLEDLTVPQSYDQSPLTEPREIVKALNQLGASGWELVQKVGVTRYLFKREIE